MLEATVMIVLLNVDPQMLKPVKEAPVRSDMKIEQAYKTPTTLK